MRDRQLSCSSAREVRARIEQLPATVPWEQCEIEVPGGTTKEPLTLYYRDGLNCFLHLMGDPRLSDYLDFVPRREYTNEDKTERLYNEPMTGDLAWTIQVCIFLGTYMTLNLNLELDNDV